MDRINEGRAGDRTVSVRLATAAILVALAVLGGPLPSLAFAALVAAVLLVLTILEVLREGPRAGPEPRP